MKSSRKLTSFVLLAVLLLGLQSCQDKVYEKHTYMANVPVYMSFDEWRNMGVTTTSPRQLERPGKLYLKDQVLYIVEIGQGLHIIDNSNPAAPLNIGFMEIPGAVDLAIKGSVLYADSHVDLLAIDISDPLSPQLIDREENVFTVGWTLANFDDAYPLAKVDPNLGIVIGWQVEEVTEIIDVQFNNWGWETWGGPAVFTADASIAEVNMSTGVTSPSSAGLGGSMARFTITGDQLYTLDQESIVVFDVSNEKDPVKGTTVAVDREVETIFPSGDRLFLGTTTGMVIYSISTPSNPSYISTFEHVTACDPVVVQGDLAYVTLRSGTECWNSVNSLDVVDISNIANPQLIVSHDMSNPHGLGVDGSTLFLCDGWDGLKVFDVTDPQAIPSQQLSHYPNINAFDVIPVNDVLIMIGADGLYQYDYTDVNNVVQLSVIPVTNF